MIINCVDNELFDLNENNIYELLRKYFDNSLINDIYFVPKKIDKKIIDLKLNDKSYIDKVLNTINNYKDKNIESIILDKMNKYSHDTTYDLDDYKIYVIIGFDTSTIYSTKLNGEDITVLLLESTVGIESKLDILLSHEFTHFVRSMLLDKNIFDESIGERLITEGIACNYSRECVPNFNEYEYCIVDWSIYKWVVDNTNKLESYLIGKLDDRELMSGLFSMNCVIDEGVPSRCGYVYGYLKVRDYLLKNNLHIKDIIGIDWKDVLM